jgi:long-chain acyl-CoA synthetase
MVASGGPRNSAPGTLNRVLFDAVATYRKPDALQVKRNGRYQPISHETLLERIRRTALGLEEIGVSSGDRVAILSENCPEWAITDYACLTLGATNVPIYPNCGDQICYILRDSGGRDLRIERGAGGKVATIRGECSALRRVSLPIRRRADLTLSSPDVGARRQRSAAKRIRGPRVDRSPG